MIKDIVNLELSVQLDQLESIPEEVAVKGDLERRQYVPSTEVWVAYDYPKDVSWLKGILTVNGMRHLTVGFIFNEELYLVAANGLTNNDLVYSSKFSTFKVLDSVTVGPGEALFRTKYLSVPYKSYWGLDGLPILVNKPRVKQ